MKPFNLEAAKRGDPVVTRTGLPVRLICFDSKTNHPIIGLIRIEAGEADVLTAFRNNGKVGKDQYESYDDLFMASKNRVVWINLYPDKGQTIHPSQHSADICADETKRIGEARRIEIEE